MSAMRMHLETRSWLLALLLALGATTVTCLAADPSDPLLDLLIQKGMLTREEANKVRAEADSMRTNYVGANSKWDLNKALKRVELFGDIRLRFEHRQANTPAGDRIELDRGRAAVRVGLRGEAFDDWYYGLRLDTSSNPRSSWITFGQSSPGPFGKSSSGISFGQFYLGWRPTDWLDLSAGKMANPLYTTSMVWDPDLAPEGAAERFKYKIGNAEVFATFGQFLYQDNNPDYISGSLQPYVSPTTRSQTNTDQTFLLAWQVGVNYQLTRNVSFKVAPAIYQYIGLETNTMGTGIGDRFIGEGAYGGRNSPAPVNGLTSEGGVTYNQIGINHLLVLDIPAEVNFKVAGLSARVFGDYAYNFDGRDRARDAYRALSAQAAGSGLTPPLLHNGVQKDDVHAYQFGLALGSPDSLGLVTGSTVRRHAWELRTYWQHVEQYALDPNLLDSDFFEGRGNLEGIFAALSFGFSQNVIGTVRYGYASRINAKLGTGGSNLDLPQLNPIEHFSLLQLDITVKF